MNVWLMVWAPQLNNSYDGEELVLAIVNYIMGTMILCYDDEELVVAMVNFLMNCRKAR
jgi:hypothetical protein